MVVEIVIEWNLRCMGLWWIIVICTKYTILHRFSFPIAKFSFLSTIKPCAWLFCISVIHSIIVSCIANSFRNYFNEVLFLQDSTKFHC